MPESVSLSLTLDRIEGSLAVLLCDDGGMVEWLLPARLLPSGVHEGDRLQCTLAADPQATDAAKAGNAALRAELRNTPDTSSKSEHKV